MTDKPDPKLDAVAEQIGPHVKPDMVWPLAHAIIYALDALPVEVTNAMRRAGCYAIDASTIYEDHDISRADECYCAMEHARRKR